MTQLVHVTLNLRFYRYKQKRSACGEDKGGQHVVLLHHPLMLRCCHREHVYNLYYKNYALVQKTGLRTLLLGTGQGMMKGSK
jgi:hypothetical protein